MSLDPSKASRFGSSKVRTGCLTCVQRHLKCGEEKPACQKCLRSGRPCLQRSGNNAPSELLRIVHYVPKPVRNPRALPASEPIELRFLEYFRLRTAPELAGVHDPHVWTNHVMQIAVGSPAIWHATVALGALHEQFENSETMSLRDAELAVPLTQYGKAIKSLCVSLKDSSVQSADIPLIACALFCAFESMGYHLHSALSHVTGGLKVLAERGIQETKSRSARPSVDMLTPLFTRLDTQRLELGDTSFSVEQPVALPDIDYGTLSDFNDARLKIDLILNNLLRVIRLQRDQPQGLSSCDHQSTGTQASSVDPVSDYLRWAAAFDRLISNSAEDRGLLTSALVLQVWRTYITIMLRIDIREGEKGFDAFLSDFAVMVELVEEFVCWSVGHAGQGDELFRVSEQCPLDEPLPKELRHQHRAFVDGIPLWCGFMGIRLREPSQISQVAMETLAATKSAARLLQTSRRARMETLRSTLNGNASPPIFKPTYTYAHGVVYLLYVTVARCRDPQIRRKAWRILYKCNRREGLWDSALAARLGQRLIRIEETQAARFRERDLHDANETIEQASQIPNHARVRIIRPTFLPDKRSLERYYFGWSGSLEEAVGAEQVWVEESMEW